MNNRQIQLLKSLIEIPSPSGSEEKIANFIKYELLKMLPRTKVQIDFQKNVIATIPGTSDRTVIIDAHSDQIGFMVKNISREGFITMGYVGGGCASILSARHLTILTDKGEVNAVVNRKHAHLVDDESDEHTIPLSEAQIDLGIRKRSEVMKLVKIGDPIVYKPQFYHLAKDYYAGYGFDDKSGCFVMLEAIREIVKSKKKPSANLVFVFSSQEETGTSKLVPIVREHNPQLGITLDVTFATDYLWGEELDFLAGRCDLGQGVVAYKGVDIHKPSVDLLVRVAKKSKIKIQYQAMTGGIGYTVDYMAGMGKGVRGLILGLPLRNMHTPVETMCMKDLNFGIKLLSNYLTDAKLREVLEK